MQNVLGLLGLPLGLLGLITEYQDLHLELAALGLHMQQVADGHLPRRLGWLSAHLNPAEVTGSCSQRAGLEKPGGPESFVHSYAGHKRGLASNEI